MRQRQLIVDAQDSQQALVLAAERLGRPPEALRIVQQNGSFRADVVQDDAEIEISVSDNELEAAIADYQPAIGSGSPLNEAAVRLALERSGVRVEPDEHALREALERVARGASPVGLVLARGSLGVSAQPARIERVGDHEFPVFPGDVFARKTPFTEPEPGRTVLGNPIEPPPPPKHLDVQFVAKKGCSISDDGLEARAEVYGLANISQGKVWVETLLQVAPDNMRVLATLYAHDSRGDAVDVARLEQSFRALGLQVPVDGDAVRQAVAKAEQEHAPQASVAIAHGREPKEGRDGYFDPAIDMESGGAGKVDEQGRIDFRERSLIRSVAENDLLGRVVPPVLGEAGEDVYGKVIPARKTRSVTMSAGPGVRQDETTNAFYATQSGMVLFTGNRISVTEVFEIRGDVNFATGNVRMERGSVLIGGNIRSGFVVESAGHVIVRDSIENATVKAAGDVQVAHGLLMDEGGCIRAEGNITARYAQNATLIAGGDIEIDNDITNCDVTARGHVRSLRGKGRIQGGTIRAAAGVTAQEIGSDLGVETTVEIGAERPERVRLVEERQQLLETLQRIEHAIGSGDERSILVRTPKPKRQAVVKLLKVRLSCRQRAAAIDQELEVIREEMRRQAKARVQVHRLVHPGVTILIAGTRLQVREAVRGVQFFYDSARQQIGFESFDA